MSHKKPIKTEDDFLFEYYKQRKGVANVYPKVSSIPKGNRITPDIDLLEIQRYKQPPMIIGHELKLLRKTDPYGPFYAGLGQALYYFMHGVEQAYLVLGCFSMRSEEMDVILRNIKVLIVSLEIEGLLALHGKGFLDYMKVIIFKGNMSSSETLLAIDENRFPINSYGDAKHRRECLLRGEFEWGKRWLRNQEKKTAEALKRESTQSSESA